MLKHMTWLVGVMFVVAACGTAAPGSPEAAQADEASATAPAAAETTEPTNPTDDTDAEGGATAPADEAETTESGDATTEEEEAEAEPTELAEQSPPLNAEREFTTDFGKTSIPFSEVLSGGPPKDGIPSIDEPTFISISEADEWLEPMEPVVFVEIGDDARAYPIQILMWHEIVNDTVGDLPVMVTFCPLCNTAIAFERTVDGQVMDFGTTGRLRFSNLIMYDRQTETWWQQATGEAIVGEQVGAQLPFVPASIIAWSDFQEAHPDGQVLSRDTGIQRDYGRNPYTGYDDINNSPFLYQGPETPGGLPPVARVLTVDTETEAVAYPYDVLAEVAVINDTVAGQDIVVLWESGTASALDAGTVAGGRDIGAASVYARELDGQMLTFVRDGERIVDEETGSEWNVLGQAVSGELAGAQLESVVSINHFWFSWAAFKPETRVYQP